MDRFYIKQCFQIRYYGCYERFKPYTFDEYFQIATIADIENIKIPFLHLNQLIANKRAVNRNKDKMDVAELEKIKLLRKEMGLD